MMPVYKDGLSVLAGKAKKAMAEGHVPAEDTGADAYVEYPSEWYAELACGHPRIPDNLPARPQRPHEPSQHVPVRPRPGVA